MKAPNPKLTSPRETPNFKLQSRALFGYWPLVLLWCLVLGRLELHAQLVPTYFTNLTYTGATNDLGINIKAQQSISVFNGIYQFCPTNGWTIFTTNGVGSTNLLPGPYTVSFAGIPKSWTLNVPDNGGAPINAAQYSTNLVVYSGIRTIQGAGSIVIYGPTGPNTIISNTSAGGGGGFNNIISTNDTKFTFNATTIFGPTNFDVGGAAAAMGANGTNNATAVSNGVIGAVIGSTNNIGLASGLSAFVNTNRFDTNGAALAVGANDTNNATVVSNGVITSVVGSTNNIGVASGLSAFVNTNRFDTNGAALAIGANDTNNATVVSNGVITAIVGSTNNLGVASGLSAFVNTNRFDTNGAALAVGANNTNNTTGVSNTLQGSINTKVSIINGASSGQTLTNSVFADGSAQGKWVSNAVSTAVGHAGNYQLTFPGGEVALEANSNLLQGVGGFTNGGGSLMAFLADVTNAANAVNTGQSNNTASASNALQTAINLKMNTNNGVSFSQDLENPVINNLTLTNEITSNSVSVGVQTGSGAFMVQTKGSPGAGLTVLSNTTTVGTLSVGQISISPFTQTTASNIIGAQVVAYVDTNVIDAYQASFGTWPLYGYYFWSNNFNLFTNPVLGSLGYGATITNAGAGLFNFKTNGVLVESATSLIGTNWTGVGSMSTAYGVTSVGGIHYYPGLPACDLLGAASINTTGNAATATAAGTATNSPFGPLGTASTLSSNLFAPANPTNTGVLLTNDYVDAINAAPDFFAGANPIPIADEEDDFNSLGNVTFASLSNHVNWMVTNGLVQNGLNWIQVSDAVLTNNNGVIDYYPPAFPNGGSNFVAFCHSNGVKVMQYVSLSTSGFSSSGNPAFPYPQSIAAADCLITNLNVDGLFIEGPDLTDDAWQNPLFLSEFVKWGKPVVVHTPGGYALPNSTGNIYKPWFNNWINSHYAAANGAPDMSALNNWTNFIAHLEYQMEFSPTVRRGHWIRSASVIWGIGDGAPLERTELEAAVALSGAWTYRYYMGPQSLAWMTNQDFLSLWRDPLVMAAPVVSICATNGGLTNRVFSKPLGQIGSSNALAWFLWKTNSPLTLTSTNLGFGASNIFTYYSPWSHAIEGWATNSLTISGANQQSLLYKCMQGVVLPAFVGGTNQLGNMNFRLNATNGNPSSPCGWIKNGMACSGNTISLNSVLYLNGLSVAGPAYAEFPLGQQATNFSCTFGIGDPFAGSAAVQLTIYTNGVQAFQTSWITNAAQDTNISIGVTGANSIGFFVNGAQNTAPDPSWEVGCLGNALVVTPGIQTGTFIGDGNGLRFNSVIAPLVVSSNLPIIWPRDLAPSSSFADTYDSGNTESPVLAEESIKLPTSSSVGTVAWHVPRWTTNAISELELQFNGTPPGITITNDFSAFYYPTNNGGRTTAETASAVIWSLGTNMNTFTVTNWWPDTNCDKVVRMLSGSYGAPTNTSANVRILRVKVQCSGNLISIANQ